MLNTPIMVALILILDLLSILLLAERAAKKRHTARSPITANAEEPYLEVP